MRRTAPVVATALFAATITFSNAPAGATSQANATAQAAGSSMAESKPRPTLVKDVKLGHKPITVSHRRKVRLRFQAKRPMTVNLAKWSNLTPCGKRTLRRGDRVVKPFADGYWKLHHKGTYTVTWKPLPGCQNPFMEGLTLQVRKVLTKPVTVNDKGVRFPKDPDRTYVARVTLGDQRVMVRSSKRIYDVARYKGATIEPLAGNRLFLEPGVIPHTDDLRTLNSNSGSPAAAGTYLVTVRPDSVARATTPAAYDATLDQPVTLSGDSKREHVVTFAGQQGQFVYPELDDRVRDENWHLGDHVEITGPDGTVLPTFDHETGWELPATGNYRLSFSLVDPSRSLQKVLEVRSALVLPEITVDTPPVTFTAGTPGQYVVAPYRPQAVTDGMTFRASAPVGGGDWQAVIAESQTQYCDIDDTSNGCGDSGWTELTPKRLSAPFQGVYDDLGLILYRPAPTTSGSVTLDVAAN